LPPEEIFFRAFRTFDFDICELSMSSFTVKTAERNCPYVGVPAFVSRAFRHNSIYVRTDHIKAPADLKGKRIGLPEYQLTACVWARIILEDDHGIKPSDVIWVRGGIDDPGRPEKISIKLPAGVRMEQAPEGRTISELLQAGEIDAFIAPRVPSLAGRRHPNIGWLFPDPIAAGRDYYKRTGIFPIMHVLGIKQEIVDRHPWVPINMFHAFNEAKAIAMKRMENPRIVPLIWYREAWEEQEEIAGHDPWEYGPTERNLNNMNTLAAYCHEQGLSRRKFTFDDLFVSIFQGRKRGDEFRF
jgi:4,5-dihydroxyphthalate decarboxylase